LLFAVTLSLGFWGDVAAGFLYLAAVLWTLYEVVKVAKYWNNEYSAGFILGGVFWIGLVPGVITSIIDPITAVLIVIVQILAIGAITGVKFSSF
jgi:hypothetical protein